MMLLTVFVRLYFGRIVKTKMYLVRSKIHLKLVLGSVGVVLLTLIHEQTPIIQVVILPL